MQERFVMEGKLGDLINKIPSLMDPEDGFYELYAPDGFISLTTEMWCAVLLLLNDEDLSFEIQGQKFTSVCPTYMVIDVIEMAYRTKPDATASDLVYALNFYLNNDEFTTFDEADQ